jgi:ankyrin repeat protein
MENDPNNFEAAAQLFHKLECCKGEMPINYVYSVLLSFDEDKMRCHIFNCLTALRLIQIQKMKLVPFEGNRKYELVKRKVFVKAISMIIDDESNSDHEIVDTILSAFPDESKMNDERSWLPMHFAIALIGENKISEDDVYTLLSADPLSMHRLSNKVVYEEEEDNDQDEEEYRVLAGCTPAHILCSQKQPKISLLMDICLRDPEAFVLCDQSGRCTLHLAAQYSESLELLQFILQIDRNMTKARDTIDEVTPLGLLCRRSQFPTFHKMVACLIAIDGSVEVISNGIIECFRSYSECVQQDITICSEGENSLFLLENLLKANPAVTNYNNSDILHEACWNLRGELGVSVLTLLLAKDSAAVKTVRNGCLPVHQAANHSGLDVLKYLIKAYPESISMLKGDGENLLHAVVNDRFSDVPDVKAKIQYLCEQCPALMHMKDNNGRTPLHDLLADERYNYECAKILCDIDETVVKEKCTPSDTTLDYSGQLPLQSFLSCFDPQISDVSDDAECVRLLLRLYLEGAGIKDDHSVSAYDMAVSNDVCSIQLQRWMLSADPTIDPVRRRNLNFEARRDGMFLAFRALSSHVEPTIWAKIRFRDKDLLKRVITYL